MAATFDGLWTFVLAFSSSMPFDFELDNKKFLIILPHFGEIFQNLNKNKIQFKRISKFLKIDFFFGVYTVQNK